MYSEKIAIDRIEVLQDGQIQIREATITYKDDVEISRIYWRVVLNPEQNPDEIILTANTTAQDLAKVKSIAKTIWTKEVKEKYLENKAKNKLSKN